MRYRLIIILILQTGKTQHREAKKTCKAAPLLNVDVEYLLILMLSSLEMPTLISITHDFIDLNYNWILFFQDQEVNLFSFSSYAYSLQLL